jgi:hypothetical protein
MTPKCDMPLPGEKKGLSNKIKLLVILRSFEESVIGVWHF